MGTPKEFFNPSLINNFANEFGVEDHDDYLNKVYWNSKRDNDCMGVKIVSDYWRQICLARGYGYLDEVTHWVHLTRENQELQAISRYKGRISGAWIHGQKEKVRPKYDFKEILYDYKYIIKQKKKEEKFLRNRNEPTLEVSYETDVAENYESTIFAILSFVGLPVTDLPPLSSPNQIGNRTENEEWAVKFRDELRRLHR